MGPLVSSTNKTRILLKMALRIIKQTNINIWRFGYPVLRPLVFLLRNVFQLYLAFNYLDFDGGYSRVVCIKLDICKFKAITELTPVPVDYQSPWVCLRSYGI